MFPKIKKIPALKYSCINNDICGMMGKRHWTAVPSSESYSNPPSTPAMWWKFLSSTASLLSTILSEGHPHTSQRVLRIWTLPAFPDSGLTILASHARWPSLPISWGHLQVLLHFTPQSHISLLLFCSQKSLTYLLGKWQFLVVQESVFYVTWKNWYSINATHSHTHQNRH